jgi:hypothetical protein
VHSAEFTFVSLKSMTNQKLKQMKKSIYQSFLILIAATTFLACKKDKDETPAANTENTWKLSSYAFSRNFSTQTNTTYTGGQPFTMVNVDSKIADENGSFKYCNLVFWFNTSTVGDYTISSVDTLVNNVDSKYVQIKCTVSNVAGLGAVYESSHTATNLVIAQDGTQFVITANNSVSLTKTLNDGLPDAPTTVTFGCNKVR